MYTLPTSLDFGTLTCTWGLISKFNSSLHGITLVITPKGARPPLFPKPGWKHFPPPCRTPDNLQASVCRFKSSDRHIQSQVVVRIELGKMKNNSVLTWDRMDTPHRLTFTGPSKNPGNFYTKTPANRSPKLGHLHYPTLGSIGDNWHAFPFLKMFSFLKTHTFSQTISQTIILI